jgi:CRP-like cAMP-binding protein
VVQPYPPDPSDPPKPVEPPRAIANRVLSLIPAGELQRLSAHLKPVRLEFDQVLFGLGDPIATIYFPETAIASATMTMADGATAEVASIGNEAAVGLSAWHGMPYSPVSVICQASGAAQAMSLDTLKREAAALPGFADLLHRAREAVALQSMHTAACNALHPLEQRLARWLLITHDRLQVDTLPMTQQFLAFMLGVYRPSVTTVAQGLQRAGLIEYERGRVSILDRAGLERAACECYRANTMATNALLPPPGRGPDAISRA